jgi:hypothetical protein
MRRLAGIAFLAAVLPLGLVLPAAAQSPPVDQLILRPTSIPPDVTLPPPAEEGTTGRVTRVQPIPAIQTTDDTETASVPPRRIPAGDPYAPLGIRSSGLVLYPSLTVTLGNTSNAQSAAGGSASAYTILSPELLLRSDWSRHEATFDLRGSFRHYFNDTVDDRPELTAAATARVDVSEEWTVPIAASYAFRTQSPSSADFPLGVDAPPGVHELKGSVAVSRAGLATLEAAANVDRTQYDDGSSGGVPVDQGDRTNTVFGGRLRAGYAVTPGMAPFAEAEIARRQFDRTVDAGGFRRSGLLQYYRVGLAFGADPILSGELKFGYGFATFDDAALAPLRAFTADGNLIWSPTILTRVTLNGATTLNPTTNVASSGSVVYDGSVDVAYAWRGNVTINGTASARHERFQGTGEIDTGAKAGVAASWRANRALSVIAGYEHEWLTSNVAGRGFESDAVRVEVKAQR